MDPKWFPDRDRPLYNAQVVLLIAFVAEIGTILLPSKLLRIASGLPIFLYCAFHIRTHTAGTTPDDYLTAINILWLALRWIDLAILNEPETDFWEQGGPQRKRKPKRTQHARLTERLMWSITLCSTYRGIGWNWRVKNVDIVPSRTLRSNFVSRQLLKFVRVYVISDFVTYYLTHIALPNLTRPDEAVLTRPHKVGLVWVLATKGVCDLQMIYYLTGPLAVALRISKPEDWPPMFGSWREMYTVRKTWGYCWHQLLRRLFESYTNAIADLLKMPEGATVTRYFKLYGAFFLSALIHHYGCLNVPWTPETKYHALFFIVQPFIITVEDLAIHIGKRKSIQQNMYTLLLGYIWTFSAFTLSLQLMAMSYHAWAMFDNERPMKHPLLIWSIAEHVLR